MMHKTPYVLPSVGAKKVSYLRDNIDALTVALNEKVIFAVEAATPFDIGFSLNFLTLHPNPSRTVFRRYVDVEVL